MTHLDVYDTLAEVKACVAYEIDGVSTNEFPSSIQDLNKAIPELVTFKGWQTPISDITEYSKLPKEAREYIAFIENYCQTPVTVVSVGYQRVATIVRDNPWC
jgi:adenylosuccinate synthase